MATVRYSTNDTADPRFMPVPAGASAKSLTNGMVHINGNPGNMGINSPKPAAIPPGMLPRSAQNSYNSPDTIYPSIYYTTITNITPGNGTIRVASTNEVPVPAVRTARVPGVAYKSARFGGLQQVSWPPAPQSWQNVATQGAN